MKLDTSERLLSRAQAVVPGITHSMMKRPEHFCPGSYPAYLATGEGATVIDVDGNTYVDFICGLGANALGHNHPAILAALRRQLDLGLLHSLPTELEVSLAERLCSVVPGAERVRFFKTGADATSAAVRLARAITGRDRIITVGYNGWHDAFMFDTPGVPSAVAALSTRMPLFTPADELPLLREVASQRAAGLLLSVPYNRKLSADYVQTLRAACEREGTLFMLDEVVTGFRLGLGGAQEYFDVRADLVCLSKALAAGMPLSALTGPATTMERLAELQVSTTFGGETLSLAACDAALSVYQDGSYFQHIAQLGERLSCGVEERAARAGSPLRALGYAPMPLFCFDPDPSRHVPLARRFVGLMAARGVLLRRDLNFLCAAHSTTQVDATLEAAEEALSEMRDA